MADRPAGICVLGTGLLSYFLLTDFNKSHAGRAALLCKCDLVSQMVGEFPELQGIMGGYYALNDGESKELGNVQPRK